jgi:hypothetical protein
VLYLVGNCVDLCHFGEGFLLVFRTVPSSSVLFPDFDCLFYEFIVYCWVKYFDVCGAVVHFSLRSVEVDVHDELVANKFLYALGDLAGGLHEIKVSCDNHEAILLCHFLCCEFADCCARGDNLLINGDLKLDNFLLLLRRCGNYVSVVLPCGLVHLCYLKFMAAFEALLDYLREYHVGFFVH